MIETKGCSACGKPKLFIEFELCKDSKDGLRGQCRSCQEKSHKEWHVKHPGKQTEYARKMAAYLEGNNA